jgi:membrane-associated phospholipid phosphatase
VTTLDIAVSLSLAVVLIVGAYQFYFWCQRRTRTRGRQFSSRMDEAIPLRPQWVWIYSGTYYPVIGVVVMSAKDLRYFNYMAFSYLLLLALHVLVFLVFPVEVPPHWRQFGPTAQSYSLKFLSFVQSFDARSNCFPSMHVSVATLTALHIAKNMKCSPLLPVLFVVAIAASCIFTKQHYLLDLPAGVALGLLTFYVFLHLL